MFLIVDQTRKAISWSSDGVFLCRCSVGGFRFPVLERCGATAGEVVEVNAVGRAIG